jgi:hypothetical protein
MSALVLTLYAYFVRIYTLQYAQQHQQQQWQPVLKLLTVPYSKRMIICGSTLMHALQLMRALH